MEKVMKWGCKMRLMSFRSHINMVLRGPLASRIVTLALVVTIVSGAPTSSASDESSTVASVDDACSRPLSDVIWGFLVTSIALAVALWGQRKHRDTDNLGRGVYLFVGLFAPLMDLHHNVQASCACGVMLRNLHKRQNSESSSATKYFPWSALFPWSNSPVKILASCDVVVHILKDAEENDSDSIKNMLKDGGYARENILVKDVSEGMLAGDFGVEGEFDRVQLHYWGIEALLRADVLPGFEQLKFLRGNSGFAVAAALVQAVGYIYAVVFRSAVDLRVSPLEVIGLVCNIILFIKASLYSFSNPCHRPLLLYLNTEKLNKLRTILEQDSVRGDISIKSFRRAYSFNFDFGLTILVVVCLHVPLVYYKVELVNVTNIIVVVPLIGFSMGLILTSILLYTGEKYKNWQLSNDVAENCIVFINVVVYIWAITVTIAFWKSEHFITRPRLVDISQLIPFIG